MRLVEYKRNHRLRDDAHCSDYMVLLDKLMQDIDSACTDDLAGHFDDPRDSDILLQFNGDTYKLPLSFLSEMLNVEFIKGLIDNLHRGPDERIYNWPHDETVIHPGCTVCGECKKKNRFFVEGTACMYRLIEVDSDDRHRESCEEYFRSRPAD